jgi:hypothetical protein
MRINITLAPFGRASWATRGNQGRQPIPPRPRLRKELGRHYRRLRKPRPRKIKRLSRSNADEEAADELAWLDRHGLVAAGPLDPAALVREPDAGGWTCRLQRLEWVMRGVQSSKALQGPAGNKRPKKRTWLLQ